MIVVPLGRPQYLDRVLAMWRAQAQPCALFLAGPPGYWVERAQAAGAVASVVVASTGMRRNAGLEFARSRGVPWVHFWDDDDYYGPCYTSVMKPRADAEILTKGVAFVRFRSGLNLFVRPTGFAPGNATSTRAGCLDFPDRSGPEDTLWSRAMLAAGARMAFAEPWGSVYHRDGSHTFAAGEAVFRECFGPAREIGDVPDAWVDSPQDVSAYPFVQASTADVVQELAAL